jgi:hypothetical protein
MPSGIYKHRKGYKRPDVAGDNSPMKRLDVRKKSSETRKRLGLKPPSNLGKKFTDGHKKKLSDSHKGINNWSSKEQCYFWKGGISFKPYSLDWTRTLRRSVRERDHYTCQICGNLQDEVAFNVHHIDYNKDNCNPDNLITLCDSCHGKTNVDREYWIEYFKIKLVLKQI